MFIKSARPGPVTAAAVLTFIIGGFNLLAALIYLELGTLAGVFALVGIVLLGIGGFEIWIGVALLHLRSWARTAAITMASIGAVLVLIALVQGAIVGVVALGLDITVLSLLLGREARAAL